MTIPKYRQIAGRLREEILSGTLDGGRLPSERELAVLHKVSRQTVRQALALLAKEGILEKKRGSGSYATLGNDESRGRIAVLLPEGEAYLPEPVVQEIRSVCRIQKYETQFYSTGGKITVEREVLQSLRQDPAAGICIAGTSTALPNPNLDLCRRLKNAGTAFVFVGSPYRGLEDMLYVSMDNLAGGHLAVRYLMSRGHTRIACLFGSRDMQDLERYGGCVSAIRDYDLAMEEDCYLWIPEPEIQSAVPNDPFFGKKACSVRADENFFVGEDRAAGPVRKDGHLCASSICEKCQSFEDSWFWQPAAKRITASCSAAICRDGRTARQMADALGKLGLSVPGDFELLYFRDDSGTQDEEILFPSLVCAGQHPARVAVDCLLRMLAGKTVSPVRLNWRLETISPRRERKKGAGSADTAMNESRLFH